MTDITVAAEGGSRRKSRRPQHTWAIETHPYAITPFMLAPVLPNETMTGLNMQARVITDPLLNPIVGWWCEYYYFYVKHRDLDGRDDFTAMMLDLEKDMSSYEEANDVKWYNGGTKIPWAKLCLKRVVEEYFRDEADAWDAQTINGYPAARIMQESWMESLTDESDVESFDIDLADAGSAGGVKVLASEIEDTMRTWQFMRHQGMTDMTYEDYLATYGVRQQKEELHVPELIRYERQWTYPANTINPSDGAPSSACSWSITTRADKNRLFKEPGFIFGCTVTRPKLYFSHQSASASCMLDNAKAWLPALLSDDPASSLVHNALGAEPLDESADGYWLDIKDLFMHGEQFVNFDITAHEADGTYWPAVPLPTTGLSNKKYISNQAMVDTLYVDTAGSAQKVKHDGVCQLAIATTLADTTPGRVRTVQV